MATEPQTLLERLGAVQSQLKVPKAQRNTFANYSYRNAEDILESVKPLLKHHELVLTLTDELVEVGDRYYIKATASVRCANGKPIEKQGLIGHYSEMDRISSDGYAREEETKKGMDGSQITGASSSYARKYALNGLFLIDDTKDSDSTNTHDKEPKTTQEPKAVEKPATPRIAPTTALVHPELMNELRRSLKAADIIGDAASQFVQATIGHPQPRSNDDAQKIIDAVKALTDTDVELPEHFR